MSDRGDIARGYQRTAAEDREVTEFLRDFDHAIVRLNALGVDVLRLRGLSANTSGAVLTPEIAAVAAALVDLARRSLPPHISEVQQVEAYLALRRIAGGQ